MSVTDLLPLPLELRWKLYGYLLHHSDLDANIRVSLSKATNSNRIVRITGIDRFTTNNLHAM